MLDSVSFRTSNIEPRWVPLLGAGGVGGLDQGEELHPGSSGLREGPEQRLEVTAET